MFYYPNGNLKEKGNFINDLKNGYWESYFESGILSASMNYAQGKLQGEYVDYYLDGRLEGKGNYLNDKQEGVWLYIFYLNEEVIESRGTFKQGKKMEDWIVNKRKE